jgi:hypothetical protein
MDLEPRLDRILNLSPITPCKTLGRCSRNSVPRFCEFFEHDSLGQLPDFEILEFDLKAFGFQSDIAFFNTNVNGVDYLAVHG